MEKLRRQLAFVIILCMGIFITMILDWMALHDIANDYVSAEILETLSISAPGLPSWTSASLEWASVEVMFGIRLLIVFVISVLVVRMNYMVKRLQRGGVM